MSNSSHQAKTNGSIFHKVSGSNPNFKITASSSSFCVFLIFSLNATFLTVSQYVVTHQKKKRKKKDFNAFTLPVGIKQH